MPKLLLLCSFLIFSGCANTLTTDSYAKIQLGMTAEQALQNLEGYTIDKLSLQQPDNCYYLVPTKGVNGVYLMILDEKVARIDIYDKQLAIKTQRGLGIGDSKTQVLNSYPQTTVSPHPYTSPEGEYLEVALENGNGIIFETYHKTVTNFRLGSYPALGYIEGCL